MSERERLLDLMTSQVTEGLAGLAAVVRVPLIDQVVTRPHERHVLL